VDENDSEPIESSLQEVLPVLSAPLLGPDKVLLSKPRPRETRLGPDGFSSGGSFPANHTDSRAFGAITFQRDTSRRK